MTTSTKIDATLPEAGLSDTSHQDGHDNGHGLDLSDDGHQENYEEEHEEDETDELVDGHENIEAVEI
jgi:hypothetical protein